MLRGHVESLAYGPHGVVRVDGKVHFVRSVAPGDDVEIEVREDRGTYAYAELERLVSPSPHRREPPCPYLPRCGGCPWQHVTYDMQLRAKEQGVRELLNRVGGVADTVVAPIIRAPHELGYRRRLSLRVEDGRVGFLAAASHALVPVEHCLVAVPELDGAIALAEEWVGRLVTTINRIEVAAAGEGDRVVLGAQAEGRFAEADAATTERWLASASRVAGALLRGKGWRRTWGDARTAVPLAGGGVLHVPAGDFSQVNDEANAELVCTVLELAALAAEHHVADLYAGAGNLSLPMARRVRRVSAVERAGTSADALVDNARRLGLGNVSVAAGDVRDVLDDWLARGLRFDAIVLDPPRSGAAAIVGRLARLAPRRIVYVSCDPATLARDVRALGTRYRLERAQPIDLFAQTHHVETVALLLPREDVTAAHPGSAAPRGGRP